MVRDDQSISFKRLEKAHEDAVVVQLDDVLTVKDVLVLFDVSD
jgi:hypothetical protein